MKELNTWKTINTQLLSAFLPSCSGMSHFCLINSDGRWDTLGSFLDPRERGGIMKQEISRRHETTKVNQLAWLKVD